jgi:hypothetical protein
VTGRTAAWAFGVVFAVAAPASAADFEFQVTVDLTNVSEDHPVAVTCKLATGTKFYGSGEVRVTRDLHGEIVVPVDRYEGVNPSKAETFYCLLTIDSPVPLDSWDECIEAGVFPPDEKDYCGAYGKPVTSLIWGSIYKNLRESE